MIITRVRGCIVLYFYSKDRFLVLVSDVTEMEDAKGNSAIAIGKDSKWETKQSDVMDGQRACAKHVSENTVLAFKPVLHSSKFMISKVPDSKGTHRPFFTGDMYRRPVLVLAQNSGCNQQRHPHLDNLFLSSSTLLVSSHCN